jgi:hypothetical protein
VSRFRRITGVLGTGGFAVLSDLFVSLIKHPSLVPSLTGEVCVDNTAFPTAYIFYDRKKSLISELSLTQQ